MFYNKEVSSIGKGVKYILKEIKRCLMNSCPSKQVLKIENHCQMVEQVEIST